MKGGRQPRKLWDESQGEKGKKRRKENGMMENVKALRGRGRK